MTLYMYQASYTAKSMAAQLTEPHDPMEAISPVLEELGAKVRAILDELRQAPG